MPTVKNGKISINLKLSEDMYNRWVDEALKMKTMNMSEFIRSMVERGIECQQQDVLNIIQEIK